MFPIWNSIWCLHLSISQLVSPTEITVTSSSVIYLSSRKAEAYCPFFRCNSHFQHFPLSSIILGPHFSKGKWCIVLNLWETSPGNMANRAFHWFYSPKMYLGPSFHYKAVTVLWGLWGGVSSAYFCMPELFETKKLLQLFFSSNIT